MKTEVREVSPELAKEMLKKNYSNRNLTQSNVRFLSKQMKEGRWLFDGQPIRFDTHERLLDGQHRLNAIIDSKTTQKFLIVSGISSESFMVMDTGKNRSGGDALSIMGVTNANDVSASIRLIYKHNKNYHSKTGSNSRISNTDIVEWFNLNKGIEDTAKINNALSQAFSRVLPTSYLMYLSHVFSERDVLASESFMKELCYGTNSDLKSPSNVLRRTLISDKLSKSSISPQNKNAIIFKAWNSFRKGKKISMLRWNKENEKFPTIL